ncbi:unnamed protein product, partial [Ascophyllum nodosum]
NTTNIFAVSFYHFVCLDPIACCTRAVVERCGPLTDFTPSKGRRIGGPRGAFGLSRGIEVLSAAPRTFSRLYCIPHLPLCLPIRISRPYLVSPFITIILTSVHLRLDRPNHIAKDQVGRMPAVVRR